MGHTGWAEFQILRDQWSTKVEASFFLHWTNYFLHVSLFILSVTREEKNPPKQLLTGKEEKESVLVAAIVKFQVEIWFIRLWKMTSENVLRAWEKQKSDRTN